MAKASLAVGTASGAGAGSEAAAIWGAKVLSGARDVKASLSASAISFPNMFNFFISLP